MDLCLNTKYEITQDILTLLKPYIRLSLLRVSHYTRITQLHIPISQIIQLFLYKVCQQKHPIDIVSDTVSLISYIQNSVHLLKNLWEYNTSFTVMERVRWSKLFTKIFIFPSTQVGIMGLRLGRITKKTVVCYAHQTSSTP